MLIIESKMLNIFGARIPISFSSSLSVGDIGNFIISSILRFLSLLSLEIFMKQHC